MNNDRIQQRDQHQQQQVISDLSFDFPLHANKNFSISDSFNISINAQNGKQSDSNSKISESRKPNDNKDTSKDSDMRNKVNINQKHDF